MTVAFAVGVSLTASTGVQSALPAVIPGTGAAVSIPDADTVKPVVPQAVPIPSYSDSISGPRNDAPPIPQTKIVSAATRLPAAASVRVGSTGTGPAVKTRAGMLVRAGTLPVLIPRPAVGGHITAAVVDAGRARAAGVNGSVFTLAGLTQGGVGLDYSTFADAGGAGYGARLHLVALPACALTTPDRAECRTQTVLASTNDALAKRLTVELTAGQISQLAAPGVQALRSANVQAGGVPAGMLVLAAVPGAASSVGDFAATKLAPSGSWSTSGGTGAFTWSYPIQTPPATAGGAPSVGLSYNSQTVDGLESNTNNQSSWVGQGFDYDPGFIERTYLPCANVPGVDPGRVNKGTGTQVGDLCWGGEIVTFGLNGSTTALVRDDTTGVWHPENDNGEKIDHIVEQDTAGAVVKESWKITTLDGTEYTYGLNSLPGRTSQPLTNSVYTVPVYGAKPGDPCYNSGSLAASKCAHDLGWRWNLDSVTDTNGNVTAYYYQQETNFYKGSAGRDEYVRAGNLDRIEYGLRLTAGPTVYGTQSTQRVLFTTAVRCLPIVAGPLPGDPADSIDCSDPDALDGNDPTDTTDQDHSAHWPDTPLDLKCKETGYCETNAPTFWTGKRLSAITTGFRTTTAAEFTAVDRYDFTHAYSYNDTGEMTLESITRHGYKDGVETTSLPSVDLGYITKPNRVLGVNNEPQMQFSRLNRVGSETGAVSYVKYWQPDLDRCTAANIPDPDDLQNNTRLCYPVKKTNPYNWGTFTDWFNKYVVQSVRTDTGPNARTADLLTTYVYDDSDGDGVPDPEPDRAGVFWHYDDNEVVKPDERLFAQFRGYRYLTTITGDPERTRSGKADTTTSTRTIYYVGIEIPVGTTAGETLQDENWLAGSVLESQTFNGPPVPANLLATQTNYYTQVGGITGTRVRSGGTVLNVEDPTSRIVRSDKTTTITQRLNSPVVDKHTINYDYDTLGRTTRIADSAGTATSVTATPTAADSLRKSCTNYLYSVDATGRIRDRVGETVVTEINPGVSCPPALGPFTDADVRARTRAYYDGSTTLGFVGARGNTTMTQAAVNKKNEPYHWDMTEASYDTLGRPVATTAYADSNTPSTARTATVAYTPAGPGPTTAVTATNPLGQQTSQTLEPGRGQVLTSTDVAGAVTRATYDGLGRTTAVSAPAQNGDPTVKYSYLIGAETLAVTTETLIDTGTGTPAFTKSVAISDLLGQVIQTQTDAEGGGTNRLITDTYYNSHGQPIAVYNPWYTAGAPSTTVQTTSNVDNIASRTLTAYDKAGRPTTVDNYEGRVLRSTSSTYYGGNKVTVVPPAGGTTSAKFFDSRGNTAMTREYTAAPVITGNVVTGGAFRDTDYLYDAFGRLTRTRDLGPDNVNPRTAYAEWTNEYDLAGRQVSQDDPDAGTTTTGYTDTGEIATVTDARGKTMHYGYDKLGRKIEEKVDTLTGTVITGTATTATWEWDTVRTGQLTQSTRVEGSANYVVGYDSYNNQGLPTRTTTTVPSAETGLAGTYVKSMSWTSTGLLATETLPSLTTPNTGLSGTRETLTHTYTTLGNERQLSGTIVYADDTVYDPYAQPSQITMGTNARTAWLTMQREPHTQRVSKISLDTRNYSPTVESLGYTYDEVGNVTKTIDAQGDGPQAPVQTTCYTHDNLSQLLMAWSATDDCAVAPVGDARGMVKGPQPFWLKYTYDDKGNRTQQKSLAPAGVNGAADETTDYTYTTPGRKHALTSTSRFTAGAPTAKTTADYTYDASGAVTERTSTASGQSFTATYTDDGRTKTLNTTASSTTTYVYDADGNILIRRDPVNTDTTPATTTTVRTAFIGRDQHRVVAGTTGITTTRQYTHAGAVIAERIGTAPVSWLFADANNTVSVAVATTAGATIGTITRRFFDPFGKTLAPTTGGTWPDNNKFLNTPTNTLDLVDMGARLYDPAIGRFLSVDPILTPYQPRQNNGYNYGWNNPLTNPDPDGTDPRPNQNVNAPIVVGANAAANEGYNTPRVVVAEVDVMKLEPGEDFSTYPEQPVESEPVKQENSCGSAWTIRYYGCNAAFAVKAGVEYTVENPFTVLLGASACDNLAQGASMASCLEQAKFGIGLNIATGYIGKGIALGLGKLIAPREAAVVTEVTVGSSSAVTTAARILSTSERRAVGSLQRQIDIHKLKLDAYRANPSAYDNDGRLALAPTPEIRQKIIQGRIRHLETEMRGFQEQIDKLTGG